MQTVEIINSNSSNVVCDGGEPPYDHPRVYYEIDKNKEFILCSYCAKKFVLK
ncbi:MAG: zinc-finger domain-containing protein [Janthinobacterium lividum]